MGLAKDNKLNILYVFSGEKAQGAEIVIERLMAFNKPSINSHLIISPGKFADELVTRPNDYSLSQCQYLRKLNRPDTSRTRFYLNAVKNYFAVSFFVGKYLFKNKIDIIHANTMVPASYLIPLILYSRIFNGRLRWIWSDHDLKYFSKIDSILARLCLRLYDQTLVVSEAVRQKFNNSEEAIVLYNGLDPEFFVTNVALRNRYRSQNAIKHNTIVIGIAASINPDKGQLELIAVFNELCARFENIHLFIAGTYARATPDYSEKVANAIDLNPRITFNGFVDNMVSFYNGCDIIINNSNEARSESLGTTIYESMACEKVVIASRTGGTAEIIDDEVDGYLFESGNSHELNNKLTNSIENIDLLDNLRLTARRKVRDKFNIKIMAEQYNRLIFEIL